MGLESILQCFRALPQDQTVKPSLIIVVFLNLDPVVLNVKLPNFESGGVTSSGVSRGCGRKEFQPVNGLHQFISELGVLPTHMALDLPGGLQPGLPGIGFGFSGFSSKAMIRPSVSTVITPNSPAASASGISKQQIVMSAILST